MLMMEEEEEERKCALLALSCFCVHHTLCALLTRHPSSTHNLHTGLDNKMLLSGGQRRGAQRGGMLPLLMTLLGTLLLLTITMATHTAATTTVTDGSCSAVSEVRAGGPGGKSREKGMASSVVWACYAPVRDERGGEAGRHEGGGTKRNLYTAILSKDKSRARQERAARWQASYYPRLAELKALLSRVLRPCFSTLRPPHFEATPLFSYYFLIQADDEHKPGVGSRVLHEDDQIKVWEMVRDNRKE